MRMIKQNPQKENISIKKEILNSISGMLTQIDFFINEWKWNHWLFFYFFIPVVILVSALQNPDFKTQYLILDTSRPTLESIFLMNYSHSAIEHLSDNLIIYLISVTVIFFFEGKKNVFIYSAIIFLVLLPFIVAAPVFFLYGNNQVVIIQGFSGITCAFLGYAAYTIARSFYSNIVYTHLKRWNSYKNSSKILIANLIVVVSFIIIALMVFGLTLGLFTSQYGTTSFGIGHFIGYIAGFIIPMAIGLLYNRKYHILNLLLIFYIIITIYTYYNYLLSLQQ